MARFRRIVAVGLLLAAFIAPSADARRVTVLVVEGQQPESARRSGAVGLYVAGRGLQVSREEALDELEIDELPRGGCGRMQRCPVEVFLSVPPLAEERNTKRYEVTIRGAGFEGVLVSDSTRIPGLVSIADISETVRALEAGRDPPLEWRADARPLATLARVDERIDDARRAQRPANVVLTIALLALSAAALLLRSLALARAALVYPLLALLFAIAISALELTGPVGTTAAVAVAVALAVLAGRLRNDAFALVVATAIAALGIVFAVAPEANSLAGLGPHPWNGGRFYGLTNQFETLVLAPAVVAALIFGDFRSALLAVLSLVVVGASATGADGGGVVVFAFALGALWYRAARPHLALVAGAVVAGIAAVVLLDLAIGGSSHVADAVRGGPGELVDAFVRRVELSWSIVTSSVFQAALFVAGVSALVWLAALRPRAAVVDAFVIALAVSLVVNDSPTKVVGYGALACVALRAWAVCDEPRQGRESRG